MDKWRLSAGEEPSALILTAHPDDETIFAGGLLLTYPRWNWQIICVTTPSEQRKQEFKNVVAAFQQEGVNIHNPLILDKYDQDQQLLSDGEYKDWLGSIRKLGLNPDIVFTHNSVGEYGHPQHKALNKIAHSLYRDVWNFVVLGITTQQPYKNKINKVKLTPKMLATKKEIFEKNYISQAGLWSKNGLPDLMNYEFNKGPEVFISD